MPEFDSIIPQPLTLARFMEADYYLEFNDPDSSIRSTHMIDFHYTSIGLNHEKVRDKSFLINIGSLFHEKIAGIIRDAGKLYKSTVYLNGLASDVIRDVPQSILKIFPQNKPDHLFVMPELYFDRYNHSSAELKSLPNVLVIDTDDSLQGYVTALNSCDSIITTDSSAYHIASGLNKPCLVLFGSIDPKLRTSYYPKVTALEANYIGQSCKSPCGKSMYSEFYKNQASSKKKCPEAAFKNSEFSPCLASFSEQALLDSFNRLTCLNEKSY
jgi:hypothetical protein